MKPSEALEDIHPLITQGRDVGNGFYINCRHYATDDVEISAMKLTAADALTRGGGAKRKNDDKSLMDEHTHSKSCQRARKAIRQKSLSMNADRMLTLTFRENLTDIDAAWDRFKYFCKLMRVKYKDNFQYVAVPEYQKRGAVHFHLAVSGYYPVNTLRAFWLRAVGRLGGNIDITSPKKFGKNSWNPQRVANYIAKYISKTETVLFNKRRYSTGGKIQLPEPMRGWIAFGCSIPQIMVQIVDKISKRKLKSFLEFDAYYPLFYSSTL